MPKAWTEYEIRTVLDAHHPSGPDQGERGGLCSCRYFDHGPASDWSIDHFIEKLKSRDA